PLYHSFLSVAKWNLERDDATFNIWIDAYCKLLQLDYGLSFFGKMMKLGEMIETRKVPNINVYTTLIKGFHIIVDIDGAIKLLKMLEESGHNPNVITDNIIIDSLYKKGLLRQGLTLLSK
ncbi:hypothetical protein Gotri_018879, partial [Gossypium trilobum]|nr:hypothetical protein [Gossypium trilobum]